MRRFKDFWNPFISPLILSRMWENNCCFDCDDTIYVFSIHDNSCLFSDSMNWKPGLFLLRTSKRGFQLMTFLYMSIMLILSSWSIGFQGSEGTLVIAGVID